MNRRLKVAVMLQAGADGTAAGTREQARHAEQLGLDGTSWAITSSRPAPIRRARSCSRPRQPSPSASTSASA